MPLAPPKFVMAHAVLQPPGLSARDPSRDELFIQAVREQFPNVISRQFLPAEVPPQTPHLTLASSSSQLAISAAQADFEVRFYGDYRTEVDRGLEYVEKKLSAILAGYTALGIAPAGIGLIGTLQFTTAGEPESPAEHVLRTHVRPELDASTVQDALVRIALRVRDTYFVNLTVGNYESRVFERPMMPGLGPIRVRPWEGDVTDVGLELSIDINNTLEGRIKRTDPVVTEDGVRAVLGLLREVVLNQGPAFVETGEVSAAGLVEGSSVS